MSNISTTRKLKSFLRYWQKEYGLQGWDVEIEFAEPEAMDLRGDAETHYLLDNHSARIYIVRQKYSSKPVEQRILHELGHLVIPLSVQEQVANQLFESGIDRNADLIYRKEEEIRRLRKILLGYGITY